MDRKLVAWARMVKTRSIRTPGPVVPVLWLFTDRRLADPVAAVLAIAAVRAPGLFGVVLRGHDHADRADLADRIARPCRRAGIALLVAGDVRLAHALHAGLHLPSGRGLTTRSSRRRLLSASAHGPAELRRARRAGAHMVFLSPVFTTPSHPGTHPGARTLGPIRAARLARFCRGPRLLALGGIDGRTARALPACFGGAGAITALMR